MIDPNRCKVDLDLGDGKSPLKLWYTPGAIRRICEKLEGSIERVKFIQIGKLLEDGLTPQTLGLFVWGGRLWEDRELSLDKLQDRLDYAARPIMDIYNEVARAVVLGMTGEGSGRKEEAQDPQQPAALNGAGKTASDSPSASSVSP